MLKERQDKYIEWLKVIANTRLIFNTVDELENFMGNKAISSNGIRRVYNTEAKLRAAFRDLKVECSLMTDNTIELDQLLQDYEKASRFFTDNLSRRKDKAIIARQLLSYCYAPAQQGKKEEIPSRLKTIFENVVNQGINEELLVLMLLDAIPGYGSKEGDVKVKDMQAQWRKVMDFIDEFTQGCGYLFESLPTIARAKEEPNKNRLMLIHHTQGLMAIYNSYSERSELRDTSLRLKKTRVPLDMAGFWNECDGKPEQTFFWQFEETVDKGVFFATYWHKVEDELRGVKYTLFLSKSDDAKLVAYFIDPEAVRHIIEGKQFKDQNHAWYSTELPDNLTPERLILERSIASEEWRKLIPLTRVKDERTIALYQKWIDKCRIIISHASCQYVFEPRLWATTFEASYILDDQDPEIIYMVPRNNDERFADIALGDNVGILTMDGKRYLGFDESMLYIPIEEECLQRYGIRKIKIDQLV